MDIDAHAEAADKAHLRMTFHPPEIGNNNRRDCTFKFD
jgi:hypothetical protein